MKERLEEIKAAAMKERLEEIKAAFARTYEKLTCFNREVEIKTGEIFYSDTKEYNEFTSHTEK